MSKKKKKSSGCGGCFVTLLVLVLAGVILFFSGTLTKLGTYINKLIYPLEYEEYILASAEKYDFTPEFICAVIYTESGFEPDAQSHAGAQGLMQLMPETFLWLVEKRGESYTEADISTPSVNIDYGCYYLRTLTDMYGDEYTAAAAYNAGNVVSDWLEDNRYSTDGTSLSSIPYKETSQYVESIRNSKEMYQTLYFDE